jgi:UDP:flavonoid glycosyltransferase YjiC (YdhE family)
MVKSETQIHVLVAPLDWGLGHATRCIPIIRQLLKKGCKVSVASSGRAMWVLKKEFPLIDSYVLSSYDPVYQTSGSLLFKIILQTPRFLKAIINEQKQVAEIARQHGINLIISDNRYGCYSSSIRSVFITHQLTILKPSRFFFIGWLANSLNQWRIRKFDECWVPDLPQNEISGALSKTKTVPHQFIGILSRFNLPVGERAMQRITKESRLPKKIKLLAILSGPEPQRTLFENIILAQAKLIDGNVFIVKGLPEGDNTVKANENSYEVNHLATSDLQIAIQESECIICRSGYSSVMDLIALEKNNIIMIPTPGQPEQEYLAEKLMSEDRVFSTTQKKLNLPLALVAAKRMKGFGIQPSDDLLKRAIGNTLSIIGRSNNE